MKLRIGNKVRLEQDSVAKEWGNYKKSEYVVSGMFAGKVQLRPVTGRKRMPIYVDESQIVRTQYNEEDIQPLPIQEIVIKKYITSNGKTFSQKASAEAHELLLYKNKLIDKILKELKLTEKELFQIVNQANIIKPRNLQIHKLAYTTFLRNFLV